MSVLENPRVRPDVLFSDYRPIRQLLKRDSPNTLRRTQSPFSWLRGPPIRQATDGSSEPTPSWSE